MVSARTLLRVSLIPILTLLCGGANGDVRHPAAAAPAESPAGNATGPNATGGNATGRDATAWDTAFEDRSGDTPIHFTASYVDARGVHRLEEWREGQQHLRRRTDSHIDLHADSVGHNRAGQAPDYLWQILDLDKRIAHRVSTAGMLHLGMLYSYYSMAHVLVRPAGRFSLTPSTEPAGKDSGLPSLTLRSGCAWWQIDSAGQPATRLCWSARFGVPLQMWTASPDGWRRTFQVDSLSTAHFPSSIFATDTSGFRVRDVDEIEAED